MILERALKYAAMDWPVFPVDPMSKQPLISNGFLRATVVDKQIEEWFGKEFHDAAIGMAVPEWMTVIDFDDLKANNLTISRMPPTVMAKTPRANGGLHMFFKNPEGVHMTRRIDFMPKVDLLATGGYVILPPSGHPSGGNYRWIKSPFKRQLALTPNWIIDLYYKNSQLRSNPDLEELSTGLDPAKILAGVDKGQRNNTLYKYACSMRARHLSIEECINNLKIAAANCSPPYDEVSMEDMAARVYRRFKEGPSRYSGGKMKIWSAKDLMRADLRDPTWFIEGILPQGVTIFAGDPKTGKSIQAEGMAAAIASGSPVWGRLRTRKSKVLYMDLELEENVGRNRWSGILDGKPAPENLFMAFAPDGEDPASKIKRIDQGFVDEIKDFIDAKGIDVVFIDVLGAIWPTRDLVDGTAFNKDYAVIDALRPLCKERDVAVVLVHHKPKTKHGDITRDISGSMGLPAAADTLWGLNLDEEDPNVVYFEVKGKTIENPRNIRLVPQNGNMLKWRMSDSLDYLGGGVSGPPVPSQLEL